MRRLAPFIILLASACGSGNPSPQQSRQNAAGPAPSAAPVKAAPAPVAAEPAPDEPSRNDPGLAGLSPAQRRAYDLGYRDCSRGRYAPDNHLEAYRIGCGAAHDREESGPPQG